VVKERYEEFEKACAVVGRDPASVELTVGTVVRLPSSNETADAEKTISGSPEEIARRLQRFAEVGVTHLIVALEPLSVESIEQFGHIVELARQQ
jgi:alkanesulfonate monooxygenase SsuD/methylene tetrahydromethanopterin reductase-like flavin-dependent oxidoreductase (luciferase family)